MRRILSIVSLAVLTACAAFAEDLYVRFNKVPAESGLKTGVLLAPVTFEEGTGEPTDAYKMDAPADGSDIYALTLNLPAGDYEYQVTYQDTVWYQGNHVMLRGGRAFSVAEQKAIVFRAKLNNAEPRPYIKFLCDAQPLYYSPSSNFDINSFLPDADEQGNVNYSFTYTNYKGPVEVALCPHNSTVRTADVLPTSAAKYRLNSAANGKVRWQLTYNRYTLTLEEPIKKLVTLLDGDIITINSEEKQGAESEWPENIGVFSAANPLMLAGGTTSVSARIGVDGPAGAEKGNNNLKIAPETIEAKMYYNVFNADSTEMVAEGNTLMVTAADMATPAYDTKWTAEGLEASNGLLAGGYTLNVWYETVCYGDTIKSAVYATAFTMADDDTTTGVDVPALKASVSVAGQVIEAAFDGEADVRLYSVSGQLLDEQHAAGIYTKTVHSGIYVLSVDGKAYKVVVK